MWGNGDGKPSLVINNVLKSGLTIAPLFYVPYSPRTRRDDRIATYTRPWIRPVNPNLQEEYSSVFGNLWSVPGDDRLDLRLTFPFRDVPSNTSRKELMEELVSLYKRLASERGSLEIIDFDHRNEMANYEFGGPLTAADVKSLRLSIGPVGPYVRPGTTVSKSLYELVVQNSLLRPTNWRRLV